MGSKIYRAIVILALFCVHHSFKFGSRPFKFYKFRSFPLARKQERLLCSSETSPQFHDLSAYEEANSDILFYDKFFDRYEIVKISLIREVVRVYWERIVIYWLASSGSGMEWTDIVQKRKKIFPDYLTTSIEGSLKERMCFEHVEKKMTLIEPHLVPPAFDFIMAHGLTPMQHPLDHDEIDLMISEVMQFNFKPEDPHKELAKELCKAIDLSLLSRTLPTYEEVQNYTKTLTTTGQMYIALAKRCNSEFLPLDES